MSKSLLISMLFSSFVLSFAQTPRGPRPWPAGYWGLEKSQPITDKTQTVHLAPDLSHLSPGERTAVAKLLEVGKIFQRIYEDQRHKQALSAYRDLQTVSKKLSQSGANRYALVYAVSP
jgi:hypothetical protein